MINAQDVMSHMNDSCTGQMTDVFPRLQTQAPAQTLFIYQ